MKRTIWIAGVIVGLLVISLVALPWVVDLKRYQERWLPLVESAVGRHIQVGTIDLTVLTGLGMRVNDLVIHEDPGFGTAPALRVGSVQIRVGFWPLLRGLVEVREVTLNHPEFRIVRGAQGVFNLASLGPPRQTAPIPPTPAEPASGASALAALSFASLSIRDGAIAYEDRSPRNPTTVTIDRINASLTRVAVGQTAVVDASARWAEMDVPFLVKGTAGPLDARWLPSAVNVVAGIGKSRMTVTGKTEGERLSLVAETERLDLDHVMEIARRFVPAAGGASVSGEAHVKASLGIEASRPLSYTVSATIANGRVAGFGLPRPFDHIEGAATLTRDQWVVDRFAVRAGGSDLSISGSLTDMTSLRGAFMLASSRLDLAELIPPAVALPPGSGGQPASSPQPPAGSAPQPTSTSSGPGTEVPTSLRTGSIRLTLDVKQLVGPSLPTLTDLKGVAILERGAIRFENMKANVYEGVVTASGRVEPFGPRPTFDLRASADGVQIGPALAQLTSLKDFVIGRAVAHMTLAGSGATWAVIAPTLKGRGDVAITDGRIQNVNLLKEVLGNETAVLAGGLLADRPETVFQRLATTVDVRDSALHFTETVLAAGHYSITAQGVLGFDHAIDMRGRVSLPKDKAERLSKTALGAILGMSEGERVDIPVVLSGRLPNPTVSLDRNQALDAASRRLREKVKEKLRGLLAPHQPGTSQ